MYKYLLVFLVILADRSAMGQTVEVKGTVFDRSQLFAMPGVSVLGTGGQGTMTDSAGRYSIRVAKTDSIYFSYLGKFTQRFAVRRLSPGFPLDMSLAVSVDSLPLVVVRPKAYRYDSLENRQEYRKVFDYQPEYLVGGADGGVGFNLDMLFNARKNRQMLALQRRLLEEEREKYVDHRFNKALVKKITGLQGEALDTFMKAYRPSYEFILNCENDYEYYKYIKDWSKDFWEEWKVRHLRDQLSQ